MPNFPPNRINPFRHDVCGMEGKKSAIFFLPFHKHRVERVYSFSRKIRDGLILPLSISAEKLMPRSPSERPAYRVKECHFPPVVAEYSQRNFYECDPYENRISGRKRCGTV